MMRFGGAAALLLLALPATAQDLSPSEADILPRVLDIAQTALVPGGIGETALLLEGVEGDAADLILLDMADRTPLLVARGVARTGGLAGQRPRLDPLPNGSLALHSEQIAIGRTPWEQSLTLAWRDGTLRVAGVTYMSYDRLTGASATCDVNLLNGAWETVATPEGGTEDPRSGQSTPGAPALADWDEASLPQPCTEALEAAGLR